ncbi:MAG TPA: hypothetical protein VEK79_01175 [Thermoanaerobaculia bacterium]|nr:hypothetical protein [Thermoanaerobaculia bacterium]
MSEEDTAPSTPTTDPRLENVIRARGDEIDREIEFLVLRVAQPVVGSIVARYTGLRSGIAFQDADDLTATIHLRLVTKLRTLSDDDPIVNFEKYVATLTYNAINDHLRRIFPARTRLKNRLRYTLTRDARLALWAADGILLAGLHDWSAAGSGLAAVPIMLTSSTPAMRRSNQIGDALIAIFEAVRSPVIFEALVDFTATLWNISEAETTEADRSATLQAVNGAAQFETREVLHVLWREIQDLRPMQRKALLLNLRATDTVNVVSLIVLTGIAPFDELAAALEMSPESLAAIWNDLPLDDLRLAGILQVTRQQVINLRKSARQRLARRMSTS